MICHLPTAVVEDVVATEVNATAVMIVWQALDLEQLIHYTVLYSAVGSGRAEEKSVTFPISQHSGVVGGLEPGQQYMFQVMAVAVINGSDVDGERSAVSIATTFGVRYYYYYHIAFMCFLLSYSFKTNIIVTLYSFPSIATLFQLRLSGILSCKDWAVSIVLSVK